MSAVLKMIRRQRTRKRRSPTRRSRLVVGVLVAAAIAAGTGLALIVRAAVLSPWLRVHSVEVHGTQRLTDGDFRAVLGREVGQPILLLDLEQIRRDLELKVGVREARVARRLPDVLEATVVERTALARVVVGGRTMLVDDEGVLFTSLVEQAGDKLLPELRGTVTAGGEPRLVPSDRAGVVALVAMAKVTGKPAPPGTTVDLTLDDRIVLRPGKDAGVLWLHRDEPARNLEEAFARSGELFDVARSRPLDIRFPHRLTLAPPPETAEDAATE